MRTRLVTLAFLAIARAEERVRPVALAVEDQDAAFIARGDEHPRDLRAGTFLYEGDTVLARSSAGAVLLYCPAGSRKRVTIRDRGVLRAAAGVEGRDVDACEFPTLVRDPKPEPLRALSEIPTDPTGEGTLAKRVEALAEPDRLAIEALMPQLATGDPRIVITTAAMLDRIGLIADAAALYRTLAERWPLNNASLVRLIEELSSGSTRAIKSPGIPVAPSKPSGRRRALVVGISQYHQQCNPGQSKPGKDCVPNLNYAHLDAARFREYLGTDRGGTMSDPEVRTLINGQATTAAVRQHLLWLKGDGRGTDEATLFVAAHGWRGPDSNAPPSIVTVNASPQDRKVSSVPMTEIQDVLRGRIKPFSFSRFILDVCHAGMVASFDVGAVKGDFVLLLATQQVPKAVAFENRRFAGGHGAFTYFLLRALNRWEKENSGAQRLVLGDLTRYLEDKVRLVTGGKQRPLASHPNVDEDSPFVDLSRKGILNFDAATMKDLTIPSEELKVTKEIRRLAADERQRGSCAATGDIAERICLEDEGEYVLLRYLEGDEYPQAQSDFAHCAAMYTRALALQPGSVYLKARLAFCEGREAIFRGEHARAIRSLHDSIALDPTAAYAFNALGIAHLEKDPPDLALAASAFNDSIRRAPRWSYPRHNLALAQSESGNYEAAARGYREAMRITPGYSYLPYNLGLLYQRTNRLGEAETYYRQAHAIARHRAEPLAALSSVLAARGRIKDADVYFAQVMSNRDASPLAKNSARHNLANALARRHPERAVALWRENGPYLPSRISLARHLAASGDLPGGVATLRGILDEPTHAPNVAARLEYAGLLTRQGDYPAAVREYERTLADRPGNTQIRVLLGEAYCASGRATDGERTLRALLDDIEPSSRKRIARLMKGCAR